MSGAEFNGRIEVVRGRVGDELAGRLIAFWTGRGLLTPEQAQMRLSEVVCVALDPAEVVDFWKREDALPEDEAERRVGEVHLVAIDRDDGVVGVSSAYLRRNEQLRMDLWHYRAFVGRDHRMSSLAVNLAVRGREVLEERYESGEDTRASGIVY